MGRQLSLQRGITWPAGPRSEALPCVNPYCRPSVEAIMPKLNAGHI